MYEVRLIHYLKSINFQHEAQFDFTHKRLTEDAIELC